MIHLITYGILVGAAFRKKRNAAEVAVGREQETASPLKVNPIIIVSQRAWHSCPSVRTQQIQSFPATTGMSYRVGIWKKA